MIPKSFVKYGMCEISHSDNIQSVLKWKPISNPNQNHILILLLFAAYVMGKRQIVLWTFPKYY